MLITSRLIIHHLRERQGRIKVSVASTQDCPSIDIPTIGKHYAACFETITIIAKINFSQINACVTIDLHQPQIGMIELCPLQNLHTRSMIGFDDQILSK